jgi:hypothetical protein
MLGIGIIWLYLPGVEVSRPFLSVTPFSKSLW